MSETLKLCSNQIHRAELSTLSCKITHWLQEIGYQLVDLKMQTQGSRTLQVFIDHEVLVPQESYPPVTIEDCAIVSRHIDEKLNDLEEMEKLFPHAYELEVSSPGLYRPLRSERDFQRFSGQSVRIVLKQALDLSVANPSRKTYCGVLMGFQDACVLVRLQETSLKSNSKGKKRGTVESEVISIPVQWIVRSELQPQFSMEFKSGTQESNV